MSPSRSTSHRSGGGGGGGGGKSRKSRRSTGALKRHQTVEGVIVEQPFSLQTPGRNQQKVGEGVYISTVVSQNKRFYGVMVDQAALKEASSMWFQEQADSLELNRRMGKLRQLKRQKKAEEEEDSKPAAIKTPTKKHFLQVDDEEDDEDDDEDDELVPPNSDHRQKRQAEDRTDLMTQPKRPRLEAQAHRTESNGDGVKSNAIMEKDVASRDDRSIQKFKFIDADPTETQKTGSLGYRVLLATFCNADEASGHDRIQTVSIVDACDRGGDFCGDYYYQYEHPSKTLVAGETKAIDKNGLRMSMGYHTFLQNTILPDWFPLANSTADSQRVLEMLNMKRDHHGNIIWDTEAAVSASDLALLSGGTEIPMQPRPKPRFQIGVIGGGVAGLACCRELIKQLDLEGIDGKVVLLEARDRLGGRLHTDYSTFDIPVDLGASWIHGIDHNPLAELAREANIDFVTAAEDVIMLDKGMQKVDTDVDTRMGKLFDDLLDLAANDCWGAEDIVKPEDKSELQAAVRWHSSVFANTSNQDENFEPKAVGVPAHRKSSDRSIDYEVGKAIAKHKLQDFAKLSKEEHRMLLWNTKNVEYALGANISDLSMKYWDADERHAFEGDHVLLKQGYSAVIEYMFQALQSKGEDRFQCITNFPVGKVEYARKSSKHAHDRSSLRNGRKLIDLSDTCSVSSQDGSKTHYFDFLVCAVPLGVLKESILASGTPREDVLKFYPSLPFSKKDSISNVGFGLLDKVFLQFRDPFWRSSSVFEDEDQSAFGNASELNPHHYMFFDVGKTLGTPGNEPAILMSLISGREAVACESLSDDDLVAEIFATLSLLFSPLKLPKPVAVKITRWGKDRFARGSYTFLPPGATDQDYQLLQTPVNGNGDSVLLEGNETMRLFFAGEHATGMHPSMSHGAMLSGIRAAKEVLASITDQGGLDKGIDRVVPLPLFRRKFPETPLQCTMCNKIGSHREGSLLCFRRGAKQVLVHSNCAEFSPEVEVDADGNWKNVIRAATRGKSLNCLLCKKPGATVGCSQNCSRVFHVSCAEDTGWRFDRDGKVFHCDSHRSPHNHAGCDRISIPYYLTKCPRSSLRCSLCDRGPSEKALLGELLAFQSGFRQTCVHEKCIQFTNLCDTSAPDDEESRVGKEYKNVFLAIQRSSTCSHCEVQGASIKCIARDCDKLYHFRCAESSGWDFKKNGPKFRCTRHKNRPIEHNAAAEQAEMPRPNHEINIDPEEEMGNVAPVFRHHLLAHLGAAPAPTPPQESFPSNHQMRSTSYSGNVSGPRTFDGDEAPLEPDDSLPGEKDGVIPVLDALLANMKDDSQATRSYRLQRESRTDPWNLHLKLSRQPKSASSKLVLAVAKPYRSSEVFLREGTVIVSINGKHVGTSQLKTLRLVLNLMRGHQVLELEVTGRT